jgi:hypothetical protein
VSRGGGRTEHDPLAREPEKYRPHRSEWGSLQDFLAVGTFLAFPYGLLSAPRVSFCQNAIPMHLASDYIHPCKDAGGGRARCRVRIYLPDDERDAPVVICSEVPNNPGGSITNSAEAIAAGVIRTNELPTPLVWVEHWPVESTDGGPERFELIVFSGYEITERAPYLSETRARIEEATWKALDRTSVEVLVGVEV